VQQMKAQAKEEKLRRQIERSKLAREKQLREEVEREKVALEQRLAQYQEEVRLARDALQRSEESAELLAEKSMVAEQEAMLLQQKASEAETEVQRIKLSVIKTEEERLHMEKRVGETELIVHRMVEEAERRQQEAERLRLEVQQAREAEKEAKTKLIDFLNISVSEVKSSPTAGGPPPKTNGFYHLPPPAQTNGYSPTGHYANSQVVPELSPELVALNLNMEELTQSAYDLRSGLPLPTVLSNAHHPNPHSSHFSVPNLSTGGFNHRFDLSSSQSHDMQMSRAGYGHDLMTDNDMEALSLEIEKEKFEYLEKSKHLQDQLQTFKSEIDDLKLDEKVTDLDKLHSQQQTEGENKYSTIQKVKRGSTSSRVAFFEEL